MTTVVFRYSTDEQSAMLLGQYRREYMSTHRVFYNVLKSEPELNAQFEYQKKGSILIDKFKKLNHVEHISSYLMLCAIVSSYAAVKANNEIKELDNEREQVLISQIQKLNTKLSNTPKKREKKRVNLLKKIQKKLSLITAIRNKKYNNVYGSVDFMRDYVSQQWKIKNGIELKAKHIITKEELSERRLGSIYVIGEKSHFGNRFIRLMSDCCSVEVCFDRVKRTKSHPMILNLEVKGKNHQEILENLYIMAQKGLIAITYSISGDEVRISYDEKEYAQNLYNFKKIKNRVMSIDMNPNYLGWSIVDWKSSSEYKVIASGIFSLKEINDEWFALNRRNDVSSDDPERIKNSNKRRHEIYEITNNLISKALYYKCSIFAMENLELQTVDTGYGNCHNTLCNNLWNRDKFESNIQKWCNIYNIKLLKVKADYSSIYGNIIFRKENLPDPVNAACEISRRGYEYNALFIENTKEQKRNITKPIWDDFKESISEALEAFRLFAAEHGRKCDYMTDIRDLYLLYCVLKRQNIPYHVATTADAIKSNGLRFSSRKSRVKFVQFPFQSMCTKST